MKAWLSLCQIIARSEAAGRSWEAHCLYESGAFTASWGDSLQDSESFESGAVIQAVGEATLGAS